MRLRFRTLALAITLIALLAPTARAGLRVMTTNHYRVHTDLEYSLAQDLGQRMDSMFDEYVRRLSNFDTPRSADRFDVYLFAKKKDYLKFTGGRMPNSGGVTIPSINVVAAYLDEQGRDSLRSTLKHEAFHQFAHSVISKELPPWLDEGMAVMFQEGIWTGRQFMLGQVPPRRVRNLQRDLGSGKLVDFRKMMGMPLDQWNAALDKDRALGGTNYNQAWAMCQFLVYATGDDGRPRYRARYLDMLQRLHNNTAPMEAFTQAFSANIDGFSARFEQWAKQLRATSEATLIERQYIVADMLVALSEKGRRFDAMPDFRDMAVRGGLRMTYGKGEQAWQTDEPRTYFRNLEGRGYNSDELFFDLHNGAALPDVVLKSPGDIHLRTIFHDMPDGQIDHESIVEALR